MTDEERLNRFVSQSGADEFWERMQVFYDLNGQRFPYPPMRLLEDVDHRLIPLAVQDLADYRWSSAPVDTGVLRDS